MGMGTATVPKFDWPADRRRSRNLAPFQDISKTHQFPFCPRFTLISRPIKLQGRSGHLETAPVTRHAIQEDFPE